MAISTAAALIGSAVIGGASSAISGSKAAGAARDAASAQAATDRYIYDTTRSDYAPYRAVGTGALGKLAQIYGVETGPASGGTFGSSPDYAAYVKANPDLVADFNKVAGKYGNDAAAYGQYHWDRYGQFENRTLPTTGGVTLPASSNGASDPYGGFTASPGYQFRLNQGLKAIERRASANGARFSGATLKAMDREAQGEASDEFGKYVGGLQSLAGVGQSATQSVAQAGQAYAANSAVTNANFGNARASAYANTGNAINQTVGNLASAYLYTKGYGAKTGLENGKF